ncbi:MAG: hypothetical protein ACYTG3_17930 [Planctomycetota bacterium]
MKYAWTLAALAVATLVVLALTQLGGGERAPTRRAPVDKNDDPRPGSAASSGKASLPDDLSRRSSEGAKADAPRDTKQVEARGRLIYDDGAPAVGVMLHLAVARPLKTRTWRNGDYPAKTIWLVTHRYSTQTGTGGSFYFPPVAAPARTLRWVYTEPESQAFVLQEYAAEVRAARRVKIQGALRDADGILKEFYPFGAQIGQPEDYRTRTVEEFDSWVAAPGDLEIDPQARVEGETNEDGRFEITVVSGRSVFFFGEGREDGTLDFEIPDKDANLGDLTIPPRQMAKPPVPGPVHGLVLNMAGRPHAGAEVRLWAGVVGAPSHVGRTNDDGEFRFERVKSEQAILWAVSTRRPHVLVPDQSSGIVRLPCNTPVVLRAPDPDEYYWVRPANGLAGFFVFVREGVFMSGASLDSSDEVGLPVGRYRIAVVTPDHRILERQLALRKGGQGTLRPRDFTDTTWQQ